MKHNIKDMDFTTLAETRAKEFAQLLTHDLLQVLHPHETPTLGIYSGLKKLANLLEIHEIQILLFIAEHPNSKKTDVVREFRNLMGYSTIYRKLIRLQEVGVLKESTTHLTLSEEYSAFSILAALHQQINEGEITA